MGNNLTETSERHFVAKHAFKGLKELKVGMFFNEDLAC
jgi:hypothetical protein